MTNDIRVEFIGEDKNLAATANKVDKALDNISTTSKNVDAASKRTSMSMTDLNSAFSLAQRGLQYLKQGYEATVGATLEYANQVRSLSQISGESAENTSRFIQVLDDYKIGADDALIATRALTKQGLAPTIDTLAQLSDQYLKLSSVEEKNAFIMKNLGKSGLQYVEILNKGSTAIKKQGDAVAAGLILNQKQLDQARELEIAQDTLGESWQQLALTVGNAAIPALTHATDEFNNTTRAIEIMKEQGLNPLTEMLTNSDGYIDALKQANEETEAQRAAMLADTEAIEENTESLKAQEEEAKAISETNSRFIGVLGNVKSALDTYNEGLAEADAAMASGKMTAAEHSGAVQQLGRDYQAATKQIVMSIIEMKLSADGWTNAELNAYLQIGKAQGTFTQQQIDVAKAAIYTADQIVAGYDATIGPLTHAGERAEDSADQFGQMGEASLALGDDLKNGAANGANAVTTSINSIPKQTDINVDVWIRKHGSLGGIPGLSTGGDGSNIQLCFVGGTRITMSDLSVKPIESVRVGDVVYSYNEQTGDYVPAAVAQTFEHTATEYLDIDGLLVTAEHPIYVIGKGWTKAGDIQASDVLFLDYGGEKPVSRIIHLQRTVQVYNLEVEGTHTYFANGVLVHNKTTEDIEDRGEHAAGGMFTIPRSYGNEGFALGNGDTASGGEKLAIAPQGQEFIDYDKMAAAMPRIDEKKIARHIVTAMVQAGLGG
jgi:hypothetical protein